MELEQGKIFKAKDISHKQVETDSKIEYICIDFYLDGDGGDHKKYGYLCLVNNYLVYGKTKKELKIEIEYLKDKLFMEKI